MAGGRGSSRKKEKKGQLNKNKKLPHFRTVCFGGFEETQIICYLWNIIKSMSEEQEDRRTGGTGAGDGASELERQLRRQVRVEMRRYFVRRRRRNVRMAMTVGAALLCVTGVFGCLIGVDRVSGNSMYPYLNNGDWIVYSRIGSRYVRDEVVVFEKDGENLVKRVAGLPGDRVEISTSGGRVVINGVQIREDYVTLADTDGEKDDMGPPLTVMDGQYLVLGDNRSVSIDSRDSGMGTVPAEHIMGRVVLVVRARG